MKNRELFQRLYSLWADFLKNQTVSVQQKEVSSTIWSLLEKLSNPQLAKDDDIPKHISDYCDKVLRDISQLGDLQVIQQSTFLRSLSALLWQTKALVALYSNNDSRKIVESELVSSVREIKYRVHLLSLKAENDLSFAMNFLEELEIFVLYFEAFAKDQEISLDPGKRKSLILDINNYPATEERTPTQQALIICDLVIREYLTNHKIALERNEELDFFEAHTTGCIDTIFRNVSIWCQKRGFYDHERERLSFTPGRQEWVQILLRIPIFLDDNKKIPEMMGIELAQNFLLAFNNEYRAFEEGKISKDDFLAAIRAVTSEVRYTVEDDETEEEMQQVINRFVVTCVEKILGLERIEEINSAQASSSSAPVPQHSIQHQTRYFREVFEKSVSRITPIADRLSTTTLTCSHINTIRNPANNEIEDTIENMNALNALSARNPILATTAHDLFSSNNIVEPLFHFALRTRNPRLIGAVAELQHETLNMRNLHTRQTSLHLLASLLEGNPYELMHFYRLIGNKESLRELDNNSQTFLHVAFKNKNLTEPEIKWILERVLNSIMKSKDSSSQALLESFFSLVDEQGYNLLALAAQRNFRSVVSDLITILANSISTAENPSQLLENAFFHNAKWESCPVGVAIEKNNLDVLFEIVKKGGAQILPREHQEKVMQFINEPTLIYHNMPADWHDGIAMAAVQRSKLPFVYWVPLYASALKSYHYLFDMAKILMMINNLSLEIDLPIAIKEMPLIKAITPVTEERIEDLEQKIAGLSDNLKLWDIYLRNFIDRTSWTLHFYQSVDSLMPSLKTRGRVPNDFYNWGYRIIVLMSMALLIYGAVLIIRGTWEDKERASELEDLLGDVCVKNGIHPSYWTKLNYFKAWCCENDPSCIEEYVPLWYEAEALFFSFRGYQTLAAFMIIGSVLGGSCGIGHLLMKVIERLFFVPTFRLLHYMAEQSIGVPLEETQKLICPFREFFDKLSKFGITLPDDIEILQRKLVSESEDPLSKQEWMTLLEYSESFLQQLRLAKNYVAISNWGLFEMSTPFEHPQGKSLQTNRKTLEEWNRMAAVPAGAVVVEINNDDAGESSPLVRQTGAQYGTLSGPSSQSPGKPRANASKLICL